MAAGGKVAELRDARLAYSIAVRRRRIAVSGSASAWRRRPARNSSARAWATSRSRATRSASSWDSMSVKAVTAPRPPGSSNGAVEWEISRIEPSLRTSHDSLSWWVAPASRAHFTGQSSSGNGVPSGYL